MDLKRYAPRWLKNRIKYVVFRLYARNQEKFECPICGYRGPFMDIVSTTGLRKHAQCPNCNALERHRIQYLVVNEVLKNINPVNMKMLHFAPESFFREFFSSRFGEYETADLSMEGVDHSVDLQHLPFKDQTYDFVFASHVLEHVPDDKEAISEIRRILKPKGVAILPVPIVAENTIEYPEPNPHEAFHVRAPGPDYFARYESRFSKIEKFSSDILPERYQLFIYEDRTKWPTRECPLRPSMKGEKHVDIVPVCYV
jgi:SAM-dependent methyltransferase